MSKLLIREQTREIDKVVTSLDGQTIKKLLPHKEREQTIIIKLHKIMVTWHTGTSEETYEWFFKQNES